MQSNSPVDAIIWQGVKVFVKRDDLITPLAFSGNKGRKLSYFRTHPFPDVKELIGHGSAQANSLYSLSELAKQKGWQLLFYVDHIATWLKQHPCGNYAAALRNGAKVIELNEREIDLTEIISKAERNKELLFIPEGGRSHFAHYGIKQLANELEEWMNTQTSTKQYAVLLPSGTGTTALYLQESLSIPVYTCACVGDEAYLYQQFQTLSANSSKYPIIVPRPKKYHFGKLYPEFYKQWLLLKGTGIEFELLYDPVAWLTFTPLIEEHSEIQFIYIHQGGQLGNQTMLARYQRKYG